ncbi:MAG: DUF4347 domain-containing protein, partial [Chromatiales bacterium]
MIYRRSKKRPNPLICEELEPRLLLSADLAPIAVDLIPNDVEAQIDDGDLQAIETALLAEFQLSGELIETTTSELVIIDTATPDYQSLVDDLIAGNDDGRSFEIVFLDSDGNGIDQISEILSHYQDLSAIHLISHGSDAAIHLGDTTLDLAALQQAAEQVGAWGQALSAEGDWLIYGCNLAASASGEQFINSFAELTGADVAASDDLTGQGGDWELEYQAGSIETAAALGEEGQQNWQGVLSLTPTGSETLVNQTTTGNQITYDSSGNQVASDSAGNFVVVWEDQNSGDVYGRLYDASGTATSDEFLINTTTAGLQQTVTVAMDDDGNFMVVWTDYSQDGSGTGVYAQIYNADGSLNGGEFLVNETTANSQGMASVAVDGSGNYIVTWSSYSQDEVDTLGVYGRRFDADGNPLSGEFLVNTTTVYDQELSAVAADDAGNFVVVWQSAFQDGSGTGIYGQLYNASGIAQGSEFLINT